MNQTTFVTALYNIQRETNGDGRKWSDYLNWFKDTLTLPFPMVIYISQEETDLIDTIQNYRPSHVPTKILFSPIPYESYEPIFKHILSQNDYRSKMMNNNRVECQLPMYNIIQYSKFQWLKEIAEMNPFQTDYFFWVDAGISRFISKHVYNHVCNNISLPKRKLIIQHNHLLDRYPVTEAYLWDSQCLMCGTMFGGDKEILIRFANIIDEELKERVPQGWINNEQVLLAYLYHKKHKELYHLVYNNTNQHLMLFERLFTK